MKLMQEYGISFKSAGNANRVKIVKWFLVGSFCLCCSFSLLRADPFSDAFTQAAAARDAGQYDVAAADFDKMLADFPTAPNLDQVRIQAGYAYLHAGKTAEAIDRLSKEAAPDAKPAFRGTALYYTALAQFSDAQKQTDPAQAKTAYATVIPTLNSLIDFANANPSTDNYNYLEQGTYYRALAQFQSGDYADAQKDLETLTQQFSNSASMPDYLYRLGSVYAVEADQALTAKQPAATVKDFASKAVAVYDQLSKDPNALIQANEAAMSRGEVLFLIAQMDSSDTEYAAALDAFRQVLRKDDMIALIQKRLDDLKRQGQATGTDNSALITREQSRLDEVTAETDPIIGVLLRMGECYVALKQPDEARTIFHRLLAHATLTPDQQQEVDFQTLYSYVLGGQTDQADKALNDYLAKHSGDPQADSISYQIASNLLQRKDYAGALAQAQRSIHDFPKGRYYADAISLEAEALTFLGRIPEATKVVDDFLAQDPTNPAANQMLLTRAQGELARKDFPAALADDGKIKDNAAASPDLQAAADAGYIAALQALGRYDDVIAESKNFTTKFPASHSMPGVLLITALAMDQKGMTAAAIPALQDLAKKYPKDASSAFALYHIVTIYQRLNNLPGMIQAAADLRTAFPDSYLLILQAADAVGGVLAKQKKFDDAIALYQPLLDAPAPDIAAAARNKIGMLTLLEAKAVGPYQSLLPPARAQADALLAKAQQSYIDTLQKSPDQLAAVGDAFDGLVSILKQRKVWGLINDADFEAALGKLCADLTSPDMQARVEMAKASLVFITRDGAAHFPAALDRYKKIVAANPNLPLTRQETDDFGQLLLAANDYAGAMTVYNNLLSISPANDPTPQATALYGIGAAYFGQGDFAHAKEYFVKMKSLPGGAAWNTHVHDADYGIAYADEQSGTMADTDEAARVYSSLMTAPGCGPVLQAKAMLGYGRILEKTGHPLTPTAAGPNEYAVHYYLEPSIIFGPAAPEQSAEGLFDAGQAYGKAGRKADAKKQYDALISTYATATPDWAAKARAAEAALGQ